MKNIQNMQNDIQHLQQRYRECLQLQQKLQAAQQDWQRLNDIMRELNVFYFNGKYQQYHQAIEEGAAVDLRTDGEYSIMSEDALWNAFHEHQQIAWAQMRLAMSVLDPDNQQN